MNVEEVKPWFGDSTDLREEKAEYPHRSKYLTFIARVRDLDEREVTVKAIQTSAKGNLCGRVCKPDVSFASWGFRVEELGPAGYEFYLTDPADFWAVFKCLQRLPQIVDIEPVGSWWASVNNNLLPLSALRRKKFKTCNQDWLARRELQQQFLQQLTAIKTADKARFSVKLPKPLEFAELLLNTQEFEVELLMVYGAPAQGNFLGSRHNPPVVIPSSQVTEHIGHVVNGELRLPIHPQETWDIDPTLFRIWGNGYNLLCMYQDQAGKKYARTRVNISTGHARSAEKRVWYMAQYYAFFREQ